MNGIGSARYRAEQQCFERVNWREKKHPRVGVLEDVWIGILSYWIGD